ncbi:MAG: hypothetical protein LBG17_04575 [Bacteroidales bacterium]|jgi:hypothetical protein|nr:hypothetical protein [Bacteroidales bacterium]
MKRTDVKIEIIEDNSIEGLNKAIDSWLKDQDIRIISARVDVRPMHDLYYSNGSICNQWISYIATIIYKKI